MLRYWFGLGLATVLALSASPVTRASEVDLVLNEENARQGVKQAPLPSASDLAFLRRIYVDLIARIPSEAEIREFEAWPAETRRDKIIDKLMADPRFLERWTVFFEDMLRLRTNATGGAALISLFTRHFPRTCLTTSLLADCWWPTAKRDERRKSASSLVTTPIPWPWPASRLRFSSAPGLAVLSAMTIRLTSGSGRTSTEWQLTSARPAEWKAS